MKILLILILIFPRIVLAQNDSIAGIKTGIQFQKELSWSKVIEKARAENKPIFVDCYTTWCGPCKKMDLEVYTDSAVSEFCNSHFISAKFQMDKTKSDDEATQSAYKDASYLYKHYQISAFPTFLFFTPDGQIMNQAIGGLSADDFLNLLSNVLDPNKNYYDVLQNFRHGRRVMPEMHYLAQTALQIVRDTAASHEVANTYFAALSPDSFFTLENISFIRQLTASTRDMGFRLFYNNSSKINKIMGDDDYSQSIVQGILYNEMVRPSLEGASAKTKQPNWQTLESKIARKYNEYYAIRTISGARPTWAKVHQDWPAFTRYLVRYVDRYLMPSKNTGLTPSYILNAFAWDIFQHSKNGPELQAAISWSKKSVLMYPTSSLIDTYANLLYKTGQVNLAIQWETIAALDDPGQKTFAENIERMKNHEPTW